MLIDIDNLNNNFINFKKNGIIKIYQKLRI